MSQHGTESSGLLKGHVRSGRLYMPQLAATGVLELADWVRDDLPDLIWPATVLGLRGTDAARSFIAWQKSVQIDLRGEIEIDELAALLDGRLTGLERLAQRCERAATVVTERAEQHGLLPNEVTAALATYPDCPASWLVGAELRPPTRAEIDLLATSVREAMTDGHREAVIKCLEIWSAVQAGTFRSDARTIDLLQPYPIDPQTRSQADSVIRASWGARKGAALAKDDTRFDRSIEWAKVFWGVNSITTRCLRRRDLEQDVSNEDSTESPTPDDPAGGPTDGSHLQQLAMDLVASYFEALETAPARLYENERQEVHAGLVSRVGREVITALGSPDLWCAEHGSHVARILIEVRVLLQWMSTQDPSIYRRFQDYGAGKAKLYSRILDELPDDVRSPDFEDALQELASVSHNDGPLDIRVVDTSDSFAGKSLRAMAEESGLFDLYRRAYYMASGITHSEWWSVELHSMERCLNVLHRGHLIPSMSLNAGGQVAVAEAWVDQLHALLRMSLRALGTDHGAVEAAFSWLEPESDLE